MANNMDSVPIATATHRVPLWELERKRPLLLADCGIKDWILGSTSSPFVPLWKKDAEPYMGTLQFSCSQSNKQTNKQSIEQLLCTDTRQNRVGSSYPELGEVAINWELKNEQDLHMKTEQCTRKDETLVL